MKLYFDTADVMHIVPKNTKELMALKYWVKELKEHGMKMLAIETEIPPQLPKPIED